MLPWLSASCKRFLGLLSKAECRVTYRPADLVAETVELEHELVREGVESRMGVAQLQEGAWFQHFRNEFEHKAELGDESFKSMLEEVSQREDLKAWRA